MKQFEGLDEYPKELQGRFNSFIVTQFDDSMTVEMQLRSLIKWIKENIKLTNEMADYLNEFIKTFDKNLEETVKVILDQWREDGFLAEIMLQITGLLEAYQEEVRQQISVIDGKVNQLEIKHIQDLLVLNERITLLIDYINNLSDSFNRYKALNDGKVDSLTANINNLTQDLNDKIFILNNKIDGLGGFSIVDVVENTAELNSKYPTGTTGAVYVRENDSWYVYKNGWQKGGSFNSISNVPLEGLSFTQSINLYDPKKSTKGKYVEYNTGRLGNNPDYEVTDFIPVLSGKTYYLSNRQQVAFYTGSNESSYHSGVEVDIRVTIPNGVKYIRTNLYTAESSVFYFGLYEPNITSYSPKIPTVSLNEDVNKVVSGVKSFMSKSKNLFDPSKVTMGKYVSWENGVLDDNSDYCVSDYIMLEPHTTYYKNDNQQCAFYWGNVVSRYAAGMMEGNYFTTDEWVNFVRITIPKNKLQTFMLAKSDKEIPFEPYGYFYKQGSSDSSFNVVSPQDNFNGIINGLEKNESVYLLDGVYDTTLSLKNFKSNVIGLSKEKVIIENTHNNYNEPPLIVSGNAVFENMILHAKTNNKPTDLPPYAAHIDYAGEGHLIFKNVDFISDMGQGVGIGLHDNQTIEFHNCNFYGKTNAFYAHCNIESKTVNQKIICKDCYFYSETGSSIRLDDSNQIFGDKLGTTMIVEFINCLFNQKDYTLPLFHPFTPPITGVVGNVRLSEKSCGNNIVEFNNNKLAKDKMLFDYEQGLLGGSAITVEKI